MHQSARVTGVHVPPLHGHLTAAEVLRVGASGLCLPRHRLARNSTHENENWYV
jgi:hypothetical protein